MNRRPNIRVVTATEAKNRFGDLIKSSYLRQEHLIVKRGGIPVVAIIPISDYESMINSTDSTLSDTDAQEIAASSRREQAHARLIKLLDQAHAQMPDVSEEEADRDINEAIRAVRAERGA